MNVGGSGQNANVSSPRMSDQSVGGFIVVGARESRVQGEGSQEINVPLLESNGESDEFRTFHLYPTHRTAYGESAPAQGRQRALRLLYSIKPLQLTPSSLRSCLAPASGRS